MQTDERRRNTWLAEMAGASASRGTQKHTTQQLPHSQGECSSSHSVHGRDRSVHSSRRYLRVVLQDLSVDQLPHLRRQSRAYFFGCVLLQQYSLLTLQPQPLTFLITSFQCNSTNKAKQLPSSCATQTMLPPTPSTTSLRH